MKKHTLIFSIFLSLLWVCSCADALTNVSSCTTLNIANEVYEMNASIVDGSVSPCIEITAHNITLNCKGFTVDGDNIRDFGIRIMSVDNVTIKNCYITGWDDVGLVIYASQNNTITNTIVYDILGPSVSACIYMEDANNTIFTNTTARNCGDSGSGASGFRVYASSNNSFSNCTSKDTAGTGFHISRDGDDNNITSTRIINNTQYGIYLYNHTPISKWPDNCYIYNNLFNNTVNYGDNYNPTSIFMNTTKQLDTRIYSDGNYIGGNFWTNSTSNGFSDTCTDSNRDGFCDSTYTMATGVVDYQPYSDLYLIKPIITIDSPESKTYGVSTVWFNVTINKNSDWCGFSLDSAANVTMSNDSHTHFYFKNTTMTDILHSVVFSCNDSEGNMNETSSLSFTVDSVTPLVTVISPTNDSYTIDDVWFNISLNKDVDWCGYSLDSAANVSMQNDTTTHYYNLNNSMSEGSHDVKFYCNTTGSGLIGNSSTVYFTVDTVKPTIDIISPINDTYYTSSVYYNVSINENTDWCAYSLNSVSNISMTKQNNTYFYYLNVTMTENYYTIVFSCNDSAGNMNSSDVLGFTVADFIPPFITITRPENTTVYDFYDIFEGSFGELVSWSAYSVDGAANVTLGAVQTFKKSLRDLGLSYGSHNITVYANDSLGNINSTTRFWTKAEYAVGDVITESVYPGLSSIYGTSMTLDSNGDAHVSYIKGLNLMYCNNTQGWMNCMTAHSIGISFDTSIAVDSNDKIHVVSGYNGLKYCNNTNESWTCVTINSEDVDTPSVSLAVDSNDKIHISYRSVTHDKLKYCNNTAGSWSCEIAEIYTTYSGMHSSIALDSNDVPYISHIIKHKSLLRLCDKSSGSWSYKSLISGVSSSYATTSITIDKNNVKHTVLSSSTQVYYCEYNSATNYSCVTVENPSAEAMSVSISTDRNNNPHIIYRNDTDTQGMVRHCDNRYNESVWSCTDIVYAGHTLTNNPIYSSDRRMSFFKGRLVDKFTAIDSDFSDDMHFAQGSKTTVNYTRVVGYGLDIRPPIITINNPLNDTISSDVLNITFDEVVNWSVYCIDDCVSNTTIGAVNSYATNMTGLYDGSHNITVYANDSLNNMRATTRYWTRLTSITVLPNSRTKALAEEGTDLFNIITTHDSSVVRNMTYTCLSGNLCDISKFAVTFQYNSINVSPSVTEYNEVNVTALPGLVIASYTGVIQIKQVYDNKTHNISMTYNVLTNASNVDITPLIITSIDMTNAQTIVRTIYHNNTGDWNATHCNFSASALSSFISFSKNDFTIEVGDYNTTTMTISSPTTGAFANTEITLTCLAYTGSDIDSDTSFIDINVAAAAEEEVAAGGGGDRVSESVCGNGICEWDETADINDTTRMYCPQDCLAIEGELVLKFDVSPKFYVLLATAGSKKVANFRLENYNANDYVMCLAVMCAENDTSCLWGDLDVDGEIKKSICVNVPGGNREEPGVKLVNFITTIPIDAAVGAYRYNILIENSTVGYRAIFPVTVDMRFGLLTQVWVFMFDSLSKFGESWSYILIPFKRSIFGLNEITLGHVYILLIFASIVLIIWRIMRYSRRYKTGRKSLGEEFLR